MEDEELIFKRFPDDKQEQVRALVNYATLMGLSGKDLVSIGGKLDRIKTTRELKQHLAVVQGYVISPIGKDANQSKLGQVDALSRRFKLETAAGAYYFERDYSSWKISNPRTKKSIRYDAAYYEWGRIPYDLHERYNVLMDYHTGLLKLNF